MAAPTKQELQQAALNSLSEFPTVAAAVQVGDPRVLAPIGAQASMLALSADHVDVARFEAFNKSRDSTVLADAALKGILPLARSCRVMLDVINRGTAAFTVASGRRFTDAKGRLFQADAAVAIGPGATGHVSASQLTSRSVTHTVSVATNFYEIEVAFPTSGVYLNSLRLIKGAQEFTYAPDWFNVQAGDFAYTLETDEFRRLWVRLGSSGVIGYGVNPGDAFELRITECEGAVTDLAAGDSFALEYVYTPADGGLKISLSSVLDTGANPPGISDLRVMSQYPAIYDHNAVYLGEFDLLLRRYLKPIRFLAVWNEQIEESVRGANVANMNTLFVSGQVTGMTNSVFEARVRALIARADDSYKVKFVPMVVLPVSTTVTCNISVVHDAAAVEAQIRAAILASYGDGMALVSRGLSNPIRNRPVSDILKDAVPALQDGQSDYKVDLVLPSAALPENFLHITDSSLHVNIQRANFGNAQWNY